MKSEESGTPMEASLRLTGIITHCSLPPVLRRPRCEWFLKWWEKTDRLVSNPRTMSQTVTLTGLETQKFQVALEAIALINGLFTRHLTESIEMLPWTPEIFQDWKSVRIVNRYFCPQNSATEEDLATFDSEIDPFGILTAMQNSGFRHSVDNEVGYFERVKREDDTHFQYVCDHLPLHSHNKCCQVLRHQSPPFRCWRYCGNATFVRCRACDWISRKEIQVSIGTPLTSAAQQRIHKRTYCIFLLNILHSADIRRRPSPAPDLHCILHART